MANSLAPAAAVFGSLALNAMFSVKEFSGLTTLTRSSSWSLVAVLLIRFFTSSATPLEVSRFVSVVRLTESWGRALLAKRSPVMACTTTWASPS